MSLWVEVFWRDDRLVGHVGEAHKVPWGRSDAVLPCLVFFHDAGTMEEKQYIMLAVNGIGSRDPEMTSAAAQHPPPLHWLLSTIIIMIRVRHFHNRYVLGLWTHRP